MRLTNAFQRILPALAALAVCASLAAAQQQNPPAAPAVTDDEAAVRENVKQMETGWNTKSGALFAKPFAEDADYVIVNGAYIKGRPVIERGHQQIFDTIYKNTSLALTVRHVRFIRPDVALVHVNATMKLPAGETTRESNAVITMVMTKDKGAWSIASFQNTPVEPPRGN